jgi:hypothetical protein
MPGALLTNSTVSTYTLRNMTFWNDINNLKEDIFDKLEGE